MKNRHPDIWQEVSALKHLVVAIHGAVMDLSPASRDRLNRAMRGFMKQRCERWDEEVRRAREVLAKEANMNGDVLSELIQWAREGNPNAAEELARLLEG